MVEWLRTTCRGDVVALTVDVGQGGELEGLRDRALAAGAVRAHVLDARDEFARRFVLPALKAGALADDRRKLATALAAPLVAAKLLEIRAIESADVIAHGGDAGGRHDLSLRALDRDVRVVAHPWPSPGGAEVMPWVRPVEAPEPAYVDLSFERGAPTAINSIPMPLLDMLASLNTIAAAQGLGRSHTGGLLNSAGFAVLESAHRALTASVASSDVQRFSATVARQYAELVSEGLWSSPLRAALDAYVETIHERTSGTIRLKLFKGHCEVHDDTLVRAL
jgi:argininosuccinate synthase